MVLVELDRVTQEKTELNSNLLEQYKLAEVKPHFPPFFKFTQKI
jgi:hypothetical protein